MNRRYRIVKKCIVFDIDGTLFDTIDGIVSALNRIIGVYGGNYIDDYSKKEYVGPAIADSLVHKQGYDKNMAKHATEEYRKIYINEYIKLSKPYPGICEVLMYLKKEGYVLAIATMKTQNQTDELINIFDIRHYFDTIKCASSDGTITKYDMLLNIKEEFEADEYVMVGDTNGDKIAAEQSGYTFIYAEYGYGDVIGCDKHIAKIKDIETII